MRSRFFSLAAISMVMALTSAPATAQTPDAVRAALLAPPGGWTMIWPIGHGPWAGIATVFFEARDDRLVARIQNQTFQISCERDVTVTAADARFDLCQETGLVLRYQPQDTEIPFRGRTGVRPFFFFPR